MVVNDMSVRFDCKELQCHLAHLALAAFLAMAMRRFAESFLALALPPLSPP